MYARFRRWRVSRPFWGGFWVTAGGAVILLAPLAPLPLLPSQGVAGISGYLVGLLLVAAGLLSWWQPGQRVFLGVTAIALSLGSFVTSNLGGFGLGMLTGLTGGALLCAWTPAPRPADPPPATPPSSPLPPGTDSPPTTCPADPPSVGGGADSPSVVRWVGRMRGIGRRERPFAQVDSPSAGGWAGGGWKDVPRVVAVVPVLLGMALPGAGSRPAESAGSGIEAVRLVLWGGRFEGVVHGNAGPRLKLSAAAVEIEDGRHSMRGSGAVVRQRFSRMRMSGGVVMYVDRLRAEIGGVGLTFTPALPPPSLPLPAVTVTDVRAGRFLVRAAHARVTGLRQEAPDQEKRPGVRWAGARLRSGAAPPAA